METGTARQKLNGSRWVTWALWAVALGGLLYLAGLTLWLGLTGLVFPYQLDYGEGFLLHFVREWSQGNPIYKVAEGYPYIMANYPPVDLVLALALTPILGITYTAGRVWTLLAIAAIAMVLAAWVWRAQRKWLPALVAALLFVGSSYIYDWAPLFRVDLVGLALTFGGLYLVWESVKTDRPRLLWVAALLFVVGLYTKQSFVFAPVSALVYLFFFVDHWRAIKMAVIMALLGGGLFLLIDTLTGGGFRFGLISSNVNPFLWPEFFKQQADFFGTFAILGLMAAWTLAEKLVTDRSTSLRDKVGLEDIYLLYALASLTLAGKAGAWENYFFEALVAFTLCAGLLLGRLMTLPKPLLRALAPVLVILQVVLMWHTPRAAERYMRLTRQSNEDMVPILAETPDSIASEDMGLLVTNDKALDYCSFQYSQLAQAGRWDQAWELSQLRGHDFPLVILERGTRLDVDRYQRFTREFLSELDRNYEHSQTVGKYELYEPEPLQHERRAEFGDQLALVGWSLDAPPDPKPGDWVELAAVWQAQTDIADDYTAFAHLVDENGQGWAGDDHQPHDGLYPTSRWAAGEMVRDTFALEIPPDIPAGLYSIEVGWYSPQERLPVRKGNSFRVAVLPVAWEATGTQTLTSSGALFGEQITLQGFDLVQSSGGLEVTLRWSISSHVDADYTVFVHLVAPGGEGQPVAQSDAPPLGGLWPTSLWLPDVAVDDVHTILLPSDLVPGTYSLLVGMYDPATGLRLHVSDGSDALSLSEISLP